MAILKSNLGKSPVGKEVDLLEISGVSYLMDILLDNSKSSKFYFNFMILTKMYKLSACGDQRVNAPAAPELAGTDARTAQHRHQLPGPEPADVHRIFRYCIALCYCRSYHTIFCSPFPRT